MEIIVAGRSGFCFGVKRAVNTVYDNAGKGNVYTFGPVIHNEDVVEELCSKGIKVINSLKEAYESERGTVIIRAHGVPDNIIDELTEMGHKIINATCPFVLKIHDIVKKATENDEHVIIIGDVHHPEVIGIMGSADKDKSTVIGSEEGIYGFMDKYPDRHQKICIVSQTTFNYNKFKYFVEIFLKNSYDNIGVLNTICNATEERQTEAKALAATVDAMIVIGGRNSSNTQKLYEICKNVCEHTFYIQKADDMDYTQLCGMNRVGITAGASTPNRIIEEVQKRCQI